MGGSVTQRVGDPQHVDETLDPPFAREKRRNEAPCAQDRCKSPQWRKASLDVAAKDAVEPVAEKDWPSGREAALLDIEAEMPVSVRQDCVLASVRPADDRQPAHDTIHVKAVAVLGIRPHGCNPQRRAVDAGMPDQPRIG